MLRIGRLVVEGYPHHVVQRGHNRHVVFAAHEDYERYLSDVRELKQTFGVRLHAYCLMTNHVHLLLEPRETRAALGTFMKALAARATRYRNRLEGRSGTLWESRYKSSLVQTDTYLLACCRYIELNPVRARVTASPTDYPWSSAPERLGQKPADLLDWSPSYLSLGCSEAERQSAYARYLLEAIPDSEWVLIRKSLQRGQLTGAGKFVDEIEKITGIRVEHRGRGRPRKQVVEGRGQ
ncbi:transposase [Steroidobacter denitrificans]|uniref:Transposase n=1 Tax=Steroidobacter denitrificans TaxID=465721 RepID=A0A127F761_STEDE|nr:transposase [Steroidobacter denitrificans]AMN46276.1 transposase [Steroidobacter denitrificans]